MQRATRAGASCLSSFASTCEQRADLAPQYLFQSLRSQESLRLLRLQHDTTVSQLEEAHSSLLRVEKKLDRLRSATVAELEGRSLPGAAAPGSGNRSPSGEDEKPSEANGVGAAKGVGGEVAPVVIGGVSTEELDEWKRLVGARDGELEELRRDRIALKTELDVLKGRVSAFSHLPILRAWACANLLGPLHSSSPSPTKPSPNRRPSSCSNPTSRTSPPTMKPRRANWRGCRRRRML